MGFTIYTAATVQALTKKLGENLKSNNNIFIPECIITPNEGLKNWIKIQLAEANGIVANLLFTKHDDLINIVHGVLKKGNHDAELLNKIHLTWYCFKVLSSEAFRENYPDQYEYFKDNDQKKIALAQKLAVLLDQYQLYDSAVLVDQPEDWQNYCWHKIVEATNVNFRNRLELENFIEEELQNEEKQNILKDKLPQIHLFLGLDYSTYHINIYKKLSQFIEINSYIVNPVGDNNNPLAVNWGQMAKNSIGALLEFGNTINLNNNEVRRKETLLQKIQDDVLHNGMENRNQFENEDLLDNSLIINNCYTATREVEVLYNYLIKTISESNNTIAAREIVVLTTDIDVYAPAIKAIFGTSKINIPYTIADNSYKATNSALNSIDLLFSIEEELKAESVVQLLESPFISLKFQFQDIQSIRNWIHQANIRFGIAETSENEIHTVSWKHGLKKMIYGFCISGGGLYEDDNGKFELIEVAEGTEALEMFRLNTFVNSLIDLVEQRAQDRTIAAWIVYTYELIETFIEAENEIDLKFFQKNLSKLNNIEIVDQKISFLVFRDFLNEILDNDGTGPSFGNKGITFCSLNQMRAVPFKVIAVLGLNLNLFPRKEVFLSYDKLKDSLIPFKPTKKQQDKYLFLQTLMATKNKLYLSYIGKDVKNNTTIPPSSLIDEIIDYVEENKSDPSNKDSLVREHPLHGFSAKYFNNADQRYYTYLAEATQIELPTLESQASDVDITKIELKDFINFFKNPFAFYYNKVLGIYYRETTELLEDTEIFELDNLQQWMIKSELMQGDNLEEYRFFKIENGELPLCNMGKLELANLEFELSLLKNKFIQIKGEEIQTEQKIKLQIEYCEITGKIQSIFGDKYILNCVSKDTSLPKYIIEFYISYLLLIASNIDIKGVFLTLEGTYDRELPLETMSQEEAVLKLKKYIELYLIGNKELLPFTAELAWKVLKELKNDDVYAKLRQLVESKYAFPSEYLKIEFNNGFFDKDANIERLEENTETIFADLFLIF